MGQLGYNVSLGSLGYKTATVGTSITQDIDPYSGARVVIHAFSATSSSGAADNLVFMQSLGDTTTSAAAASAASTVTLTADPAPAGAAIAANDVVVFEMDDGSYHWTTVSSWTAGTKTLVVNDAFDDTIAAGSKVWCLGVATDTGHLVYKMTANTTHKEAVEGGLFFGKSKYSPMRVYNANSTTGAGSNNYVSYSYVNK